MGYLTREIKEVNNIVTLYPYSLALKNLMSWMTVNFKAHLMLMVVKRSCKKLNDKSQFYPHLREFSL